MTDTLPPAGYAAAGSPQWLTAGAHLPVAAENLDASVAAHIRLHSAAPAADTAGLVADTAEPAAAAVSRTLADRRRNILEPFGPS